MAKSKAKSVYVCSSCGYESAKWFGCCPGCDEWNTMHEELKATGRTASKSLSNKNLKVLKLSQITSDSEIRHKTGSDELDRVLGGGLVTGSLVLLSGDPGIGKSTILLQICEHLGNFLDILYVSGEESAHQLKIRAERLNVKTSRLNFMCETDTELVSSYIRSSNVDLVIIDSIQTMNLNELSSSPGSVSQVRESTNMLMRCAKELSIPLILVGHVNKDGNIAGPKVLEHVVDAVLYLEGERHLSYRILRAVKNRFGATNEIGVFEMKKEGLVEVPNPSQMLIAGRPLKTPGTCISCVMEGSRPILAEVQGLVTPTGFGNPRRTSTGFDYNRMSMLLAVLEKRAGFFFGNMDAYLNIVGGLKLEEPANDLPAAIALISSLKDLPVRDDALAFGEIGLAGELRSVGNCELRIKEAARLGFKLCVIPQHNFRSLNTASFKNIEIIGAASVRQAFEAIL